MIVTMYKYLMLHKKQPLHVLSILYMFYIDPDIYILYIYIYVYTHVYSMSLYSPIHTYGQHIYKISYIQNVLYFISVFG